MAGSISEAFWHHWRHLRVVDVDDDGIELRVLSVLGCLACRALWDALTPVTVRGREVFPATRAERYSVFGRRAYLRDDAGAARIRGADEPRLDVDEPVSVQRVRRFTDWSMRRPLERY